MSKWVCISLRKFLHSTLEKSIRTRKSTNKRTRAATRVPSRIRRRPSDLRSAAGDEKNSGKISANQCDTIGKNRNTRGQTPFRTGKKKTDNNNEIDGRGTRPFWSLSGACGGVGKCEGKFASRRRGRSGTETTRKTVRRPQRRKYRDDDRLRDETTTRIFR